MLLFSVPIFAQDCVTKFMGIPVDGTKEEMVSALEKEGFKNYGEYLVGEFNGRMSGISILTNKGKVYQVVVHYNFMSGSMDESIARMTFNNLFLDFSNNPKYMLFKGEEIPEGEDIEHEMWVNKKFYDAVFFQVGDCSNGHTKRLVGLNIYRDSYHEFYIVLGYANSNNCPNGEDL